MAWVLMAIGVPSLVFFGIAFSTRGAAFTLGMWCLWPVCSFAAMAFGIYDLRRMERQRAVKEGARSPQLFMTDLLTVSMVIAVYLAVVQAAYPAHFVTYGLWGGGALLCAMVLGLLHASRRGFMKGMERSAFALGSLLTLLGLGGAGLLGFFVVFACCIGEITGVCNWLLYNEGRRVLTVGLAGAAALVAGIFLRAAAARRRERSERKPHA